MLKLPVTPPMVSVVTTAVVGLDDEVLRTLIRLPDEIVAGTVADQALQVAPPSVETE